MRVEIRAIGRIKAGPERGLVDQYLDRANGVGRGIGLGPVSERELDPRTLKDKSAETQALIADLPAGALVFALDEMPVMTRGQGVTLQRYRDGGLSDATTLKLEDGLSWTMGGKGDRTRTESEIAMWKVARGAAGRMPPTGFPKDNRF